MANFLNSFFGVGNNQAESQARQARNNLAAADAIGAAAQGVGGDPLAAHRQARNIFTQEQAQADAANAQARLAQNEANKTRMVKGISSVIKGATDAGAFYTTQAKDKRDFLAAHPGLNADGTPIAASTQAAPAMPVAGSQAPVIQAAAPAQPAFQAPDPNISGFVSVNPYADATPAGTVQLTATPAAAPAQPVGGSGAPMNPSQTSFLQEQQRQNGRNNGLQTAGNLINLGITAASLFSDERTKDNVTDAEDDTINEFLSNISAKEYDYKKPFMGNNKNPHRVGVMAQDLEKSKVGRTIVRNDHPSGMKTLDGGAAISALLAAATSMNKRLNKIEGK